MTHRRPTRRAGAARAARGPPDLQPAVHPNARRRGRLCEHGPRRRRRAGPGGRGRRRLWLAQCGLGGRRRRRARGRDQPAHRPRGRARRARRCDDASAGPRAHAHASASLAAYLGALARSLFRFRSRTRSPIPSIDRSRFLSLVGQAFAPPPGVRGDRSGAAPPSFFSLFPRRSAPPLGRRFVPHLREPRSLCVARHPSDANTVARRRHAAGAGAFYLVCIAPNRPAELCAALRRGGGLGGGAVGDGDARGAYDAGMGAFFGFADVEIVATRGARNEASRRGFARRGARGGSPPLTPREGKRN